MKETHSDPKRESPNHCKSPANRNTKGRFTRLSRRTTRRLFWTSTQEVSASFPDFEPACPCLKHFHPRYVGFWVMERSIWNVFGIRRKSISIASVAQCCLVFLGFGTKLSILHRRQAVEGISCTIVSFAKISSPLNFCRVDTSLLTQDCKKSIKEGHRRGFIRSQRGRDSMAWIQIRVESEARIILCG